MNKKSAKEPLGAAQLSMAALTGVLIGFAIISFFVFGVDAPNPDWGSNWRIKPLILTPLASGLGAFLAYSFFKLGSRFGVNKAVAFILACIMFLVILWLGVVLGLNGTMWD